MSLTSRHQIVERCVLATIGIYGSEVHVALRPQIRKRCVAACGHRQPQHAGDLGLVMVPPDDPDPVANVRVQPHLHVVEPFPRLPPVHAPRVVVVHHRRAIERGREPLFALALQVERLQRVKPEPVAVVERLCLRVVVADPEPVAVPKPEVDREVVLQEVPAVVAGAVAEVEAFESCGVGVRLEAVWAEDEPEHEDDRAEHDDDGGDEFEEEAEEAAGPTPAGSRRCGAVVPRLRRRDRWAVVPGVQLGWRLPRRLRLLLLLVGRHFLLLRKSSVRVLGIDRYFCLLADG
jgi:hypothetical protein